MNKFVGFSLAALLSACQTLTPANVAQVSGDLVQLSQDIQSDVAANSLTAAQVTTATADLVKIEADVNALDTSAAGTTPETALNDFLSIVNEVSPFLPEIGALVSLAGPQKHTGAQSPLASKAQIDFTKLKADVAKSHG